MSCKLYFSHILILRRIVVVVSEFTNRNSDLATSENRLALSVFRFFFVQFFDHKTISIKVLILPSFFDGMTILLQPLSPQINVSSESDYQCFKFCFCDSIQREEKGQEILNQRFS